MNRLIDVHFKGTFSDFQKRVLDNAGKYLKDGKINIVAAPGSGKTVLGLELIRRLGEPCLILSPTMAIREQWGQRFRELFLENESQFEELFSTNLHKPKLINSITYQALYAAMEHIPETLEGEEDCSDIDLLRTLRKYGIKTLCLDEAHHLKNEWQKSLEKFLSRLDGDVKRICLTATPPYDADRTEWTRYYKICGEIDEEIFVPELVARGNLCPHQDYVYFNYPSAKEAAAFWEYKKQVRATLEEVAGLPCIRTVTDFINKWDIIYDYAKKIRRAYPEELEALLVLLTYYEKISSKMRIQAVIGRKSLPEPREEYFEKALDFILNPENGFEIPTEQIEELIQVLRKHQVYKRKKVHLTLTENLRKNLISSVGKLKSIGDITTHEYRTLGKGLRMLILTDYNRGTKENLSKIGTGESFHDISVVSIFETLRRLDETMKIGVLSGSLIFLPQSMVPEGTMVKAEPLGDTGYARVEMYGSNRDRIELVGGLFREGKIQVLIGTKALLGEGWDEPVINTLILASFVGSFVSSNQMRGRAIRRNPQDPDKTANIWHLVTLEPGEVVKESALERLVAAVEGERDSLYSCDYEVVKRRFDTFMAPHYETGEIQSGMDRLTLIRPPFDPNSILRINREMLELSEERIAMGNMWREQLVENAYQVVVETMLPLKNRLPSYKYLWKRAIVSYGFASLWGVFLPIIWILILVAGIMSEDNMIGRVLSSVGGSIISVPFIFLFGWGYKEMYFPKVKKVLKTLSCNRTPAAALENLGKTLAEVLEACKIIGKGTTVEVVKGTGSDQMVGIQLQNATMHDQNIFHTAMREMMSPIEKPRYLIVPIKGKDRYRYTLACPSIIGKTKEFVTILERLLEKNLGRVEAVYTGYEEGRKVLNKCRDVGSAVQRKASEQELPLLQADTKYVVVKKEKELFLTERKDNKS